MKENLNTKHLWQNNIPSLVQSTKHIKEPYDVALMSPKVH